MSYCDYCKDLPSDNHHKIYHDYFYGFNIQQDDELFGRFILEIFQAGLTWDLILKKQENFRTAFSNFDIEKIAHYNENKVEELVQNKGIIRNRLKITSVIYNANVLLNLKREYGSFKGWIDSHHPLELKDWVKLFKKTFKFTGPEIVNEFLMSTGYLPGAHDEDCPVFRNKV